MKNAKSEITSHNKQLLASKTTPQDKTCNCRSKANPCPLQGYCLTDNLVYKAEITTEEGDHKIYIGTSGNAFKERYNGHKTTLKNRKKINTTELSKYFWKLKDEGKTPTIKWSIVNKIKNKINIKSGCTL